MSLTDPSHSLRSERSILSPIFSRYKATKVLYPWTEHPDPYAVWISEIMLQQTVVHAVVSYFNKWMERFPNIKILAETEEVELLRFWEGLGYYSRCRNILKAAKIIVKDYNGVLPSELKELKALPGLGDYTAKAILCQGFNTPAVAIDANIKRIALRFFFLEGNYDWSVKIEKSITPKLEEESKLHSPPVFHNALMQFGQQVCKAKNPLCEECPISKDCLAFAANKQNEIPPKKKKVIKLTKSDLALIVQSSSQNTSSRKTSSRKIGMIQRAKGIGKGLWFIPKEEEIPGTLRELLPSNSSPLEKRVHLYTTNKEELNPILYQIPSSSKSKDIVAEDSLYESKDGEGLKWIKVEELPELPVPSVYRKILEEMQILLK